MKGALPDNATLIERIDVAPQLAIFRVRPDDAPVDGGPWFVPGQYVTLGLGDLQRAYSIASDPGERRWLEFYIRYARNPETETPLTHRLFELAAGARLHAGEKIAGRFTLERTAGAGDERVKVLVAAGTGLAPFVSMVRDASRHGAAERLARLAILHGVSHPNELGYRDELEAARDRFGLRYVPSVSRPAENPGWRGRTGRVETLLAAGATPSIEPELGLGDGGMRPDRALAYVCGFRGTIAGTVRSLLRRGFVPEDRRLRRLLQIPETAVPSLFFEQYDLEPVFDPADQPLLDALRAEFPRG